MKDYEILSRASAFLLSVDGRDDDPVDGSSTEKTKTVGPYDHLSVAEKRREERKFRQRKKYSYASPGTAAASGQAQKRSMMDLGWLEFVPREVRPQVHVVASSHVLAPYLWRDYYPQEWLKHVRPEHCVYSIEVYDPAKPQSLQSLAKFALNKDVFHHPEGRDIALLHFAQEQEKSSLQLLKQLGVEVLHLRHADKLYQKHEEVWFDGFVVSERNTADQQTFLQSVPPQNKPQQQSQAKNDVSNEDTRVFYPYTQPGKLSMHTKDRFFATTSEPLPEGLCGAPVLDVDGDLCGIVEGIVPTTHKDQRLAGSAAFMPSFVMQQFVDFVERNLLEQMMPKDLFQMIVTAKTTNSVTGGLFQADEQGNFTKATTVEDAYNMALDKLKKRYTPEQYAAILQTIEDERKEVLDIMDKEGGDLDDIIRRVRQKTLQIRELVLDQYRKGQVKGTEEIDHDDTTEKIM